MGCIYLMILKAVLKTIHVCVLGHEQHALYDSYIIDVVYDTTENYFERGKFGRRNFHVTKTPLFMIEVFNFFSFYLPMLVTLCFHDLFLFKFPRHRKWVRLKYVSYLLLASLLCFNSYSLVSISYNPHAYLKGIKESACWEATQFVFSFCS